MKRGFGAALVLAVLLWAGSAFAVNVIYDRVDSVNWQATKLAPTSGTVLLWIYGEARPESELPAGVGLDNFIVINTFLGTAPNTTVENTLNRCQQFAQKVLNRPNRFDLRVEVLATGFGPVEPGGPVGMSALWPNSGSLHCELIRDSQ